MTALEKLKSYTPVDVNTNTAPATDKKTVVGALDRLRAYTPIDARPKEVKGFDPQAMLKASSVDTRAKQIDERLAPSKTNPYYSPEFSKWAETERKGVADTVGALYNTPKKVADFMKTTGKKAEAQGLDKLSKVSDNAVFDGANSYESEYTKWRSTVRNEQDVEKDIKKITSRISSIEANRADDAKKAYYTQGDEGYDTVNSSAQSELEALKKEKALLEEERTWSKYFAYDNLKNNDDFEEKSEYKTTRQDTPIFGIKKYNPVSRREYTEYYSDGDAFDDILYDYINGNADAKAINFEDNRYRKFNNFHFEEMTEDEVKTFNYIYATEGPEKAYEYIEFLEKAIAQTGESTLYRRRRDEIEKEAREFAKAHPVGSSIISILNAPNKITTFPTQVIDLIKNGEINQDADYNRLNFESAATTQAVSENMNDTGKLLYNIAMGLGSYGTTLMASLGNPAASLAIMSTSVAGDTVIEARDRGLNNAQALSLGIVAAAAELIMEKIGLDALFGGSWSKSGIRYIAKNALTEGLEEPGTNLINTFADILVSGDKSQWQSSIKNYKAQGMTESQAWVNAVKDKALELGIDGIAGALSGAAMSSVFSAPQIASDFNKAQSEWTGKNKYFDELEARAKASGKSMAELYLEDYENGALKSTSVELDDNNTASVNETVETMSKDGRSIITVKLSKDNYENGLRFKNFINSVNSMLDKSLISKRKHKIGEASKNHTEIVNSLMKTINPRFSSEGYQIWIDGTGASHTYIRHGENGKADKSMFDEASQFLIPWAIQNADSGEFVLDKNGNVSLSTRFQNSDGSYAPQIRIEKKVGNNTIYVSECVPDSTNKIIWITSSYIKKGSKGQLLNIEEYSSPQLTSETSLDSNATNISIPHPDSSVNPDTSDTKDEASQLPYTVQNDPLPFVTAEEYVTEEYREKTASNRAFTDDPTKYEGKERYIVERAIASGVLNDTEASHRLVDLAAKLYSRTGVEFEFVNNERLKESGFSVGNRFVNGVYTGKTVLINAESRKAWQSVIGHEITHVLEGSKYYDSLQRAVIGYANQIGVYEDKHKAVARMYRTVKNADINEELTAELVGEYLFSDEGFVNSLAAKHPNLAQRILNEIKHVISLIKANTPEARKLLTAQHRLERALNSKLKNNSGEVRYSLTQKDVRDLDINWDPDNFSTLKEQLIAHLDEVNSMQPVVDVTYSKQDKRPYYKVLEDTLKKSFGNKIDVQGLGSILFDEDAISSIENYAKTDPERAAAIASPYVIKKGKIISGHKNHKGQGTVSITFAAPAILNGEKGNIVVSVMFGKGRVHSLRVLSPEGKAFELLKTKDTESRTEKISFSMGRSNNATVDPYINSMSENMITSPDGNVNGKYSLSPKNVEQSDIGAYSTPLVDLYYKGNGEADTADDVEPIVLKTAEEMYPDARADSIAEGQATVKGANLQKLESLEKELEELGISRHDTKVSFDDEIAGLQFLLSQKRNDTSKTATQLKARIARLERLRDDSLAILDKRIEDVQARIDKMGTPEFKQREQRMSKREEYDLLMQQLIGDSSTWRDKKLGLHYSTNTLRRNLRDIIRKADGTHDIERADAIWDELQGKYNVHEAQLIREANSIKSPYADMKITRAEDAYIQMLGELRHNPDTTLTEDDVSRFYDEHKNEIDTKKVERAIKMARETYDGLFARLNETLREQGMKEIPYREGYFPHFTDEKQGWFARLFNWKIKSNEIPTDIAGLTETFNPERSYQPFNKERKSDITDYSFTKGLDSYVQGALDWIYHIEDIQKRRAFENRIRYEHSDKGAQEEIDKIIAEGHDEETTQALIDKVLETKSNPLNNFVIDFRKQTNTLAGKKSTSDRSTETALNRKFYSVMDNVSSRVSGNMIGGNIRSALTNFISVTQSWGEVSLGSSLKAFGDFISTTFKNDGLTEKSAFLTNRLEKVEKLYKSGWDKVSDSVSIPMEMIDSLSSEVIWRGKYYDNIKEGMSEAQAIYNADVFCSSVMASRSRGEMPTAFEAKNFISRIFTAFQLEVNNQYGYMFKDMPRDLKNEGIGRLIFGYVKMFIGAALFNLVFKELTGNDAAFDPIGMAADTIRDIRDGDENTVSNLVDNIVEELPFVGGYFGGGRFPLESALPYGSVSELIDGLPQDLSRIGNGGLKSIAKELENPATYLFLPTGGGQISKTVKGGIALAKGGSYKTDSKGDEKLQYPYYSDEGAKSVGNAAKALIFGKSSLPTAQDWVEGGFKSYTSDQTRAYEEMKAVGAGEREALELINTIRTTEKTKDKRSALRNSNVSDEAKLSLYYNMLASNTESERATLDRISSPSAINVILDIKNADKMHNKAKLILDGTLDSHDRVLLFEEYIGDDSESYDKLIDTGLSEGVAVHLALSLKALEPLGNKTSVSQAQKWDAVAQAGYPEETTLEALKALVTEDAQSKRLDLCYDNDVPLKAFTALKLNMSEYDTNGNGSYSAAEYQKAIDGLFPTSYGFALPGGDNEISLTVQQKAALWQIVTGSSSVKNNPYGDYASGIAQAFNDGKASESGTQPKYNLPERKFNLPKREYNFPTRQ
ncbi:MAG: hypothetical protein IKV53_07205 [Clostridia bacterium]|nr:hypothetical protein [Clostridia bacterium]